MAYYFIVLSLSLHPFFASPTDCRTDHQKSDGSSHNVENRWKLMSLFVTADWLWGFKDEAIK